VGRQTNRRVRAVALALAALGALARCGEPPANGADDAGSPDAQALDAGAVPDAAPLADAAAAPDADPDNPFSIRLTEVTGTFAEPYYGGRATLDPWGVGSGTALADLDGDGDIDVVLARTDNPASGRPGGPPTLLRNTTGDFGGFEADAVFGALLAGVQAHAAAAGDYDRDGDIDLFLACAGADRLLANDGSGVFTDVTVAAGVAGPSGDVSVGAMWADLNGDGLLDLYVAAHTPANPPASHPLNANRLYINLADGTFADGTASAGAAGDGVSQATMVADLDNDGALEIYAANDGYAVDGTPGLKGTGLDADAYYDLIAIDGEGMPSFVDRGAEVGITAPRSSMGLALADLDRDGYDDVYVSDWGTNHVQLWNAGLGVYTVDPAPWGLEVRNNAAGTLFVSWSARFVDLDRDGLEEIYVVNGSISEPLGCDSQSQLDVFLRRPAVGPFVDITERVGLPYDFLCPAAPDTPLEGRGLAVGDLDGDGDDDLVVSGYVEPYRFYRNDTPQTGRHRLRVRLAGTVSAPDPIGAVLQVTPTAGTKQRRTLYAGGDTHSQSARVLEAGLGDAVGVDDARVTWPSGLVQRIEVPIDTTTTVVEPEWLTLSGRVVAPADAPPVLTYAPVDELGVPLGVGGAGKTVVVLRSDGAPVTVTDAGDGTYSAPLPHPGIARRTTVTLEVDGELARPRLLINYR
jgi:hypothetical protein